MSRFTSIMPSDAPISGPLPLPFVSRKVNSTDCTNQADLTPALALAAGVAVLAAPVVGAVLVGGLTYGLLQSDNAG